MLLCTSSRLKPVNDVFFRKPFRICFFRHSSLSPVSNSPFEALSVISRCPPLCGRSQWADAPLCIVPSLPRHWAGEGGWRDDKAIYRRRQLGRWRLSRCCGAPGNYRDRFFLSSLPTTLSSINSVSPCGLALPRHLLVNSFSRYSCTTYRT